MGAPPSKFIVRFEAKKGPPWVIEVLAANSAAALEKAVREMRYIYAQDPARFNEPSIDWAGHDHLQTNAPPTHNDEVEH